MASGKIFPNEFFDSTIEYYWLKVCAQTKAIYFTLLFLTSVLLASLPLIKIDITVSSRGIIRSQSERLQLFAPVTGKIKEISIRENQVVKKGQVLLVIDPSLENHNESFYESRLGQLMNYLNDLGILISLDSSTFHKGTQSFITILYAQKFYDVQSQLDKLYSSYSKLLNNYERQQDLYREKVISEVEFENSQYELDQSALEISLLIQRSRSGWLSESEKFNSELKEIKHRLSTVRIRRDQFEVRAPIGGSIQKFIGIQTDSYVYANQQIALISPEEKLIAENYISPSDIGMLNVGQPATIQLDAFNYNNWGSITSQIIDISRDVIIADNEVPYFVVKSQLTKDYLSLKNGHKGYLKKGMTINSRFVITERSLFQILFDKADDWLNPAIKSSI